jgi:hypothetical protein
MTKGIQIRRGTTSQHSSFTGREGEITVDTTKQVVVVHDNLTSGGYPLVSETLPQTVSNKTIIAGSGTSTGTTSQPLQVVGGVYVSGNLGVGITNPEARLHLYDAAGSAAWRLRIGTNVSDGAGFYQRANGDFEMVVRDASNNNNYLVGSSGNISLRPVSNVLVKTETPTGTASQSLQVSGGAYVSGNLGIGATNPTAQLNVVGQTDLSGSLIIGSGITMTSASGIISATSLRPAGGTTTVAPIQFTSGTNLTTQTAGSLEYNGNAFFATQNASTGRGMVLAPTIVRTSGTLTHGANTTLESLFDTANDTLSLVNDTLHWFRGVLLLNKASSGVSNTLNIAFTFSQAVQTITYQYETYTTTATTSIIQRANVTTSASNAIDVTGTTSQSYYVKLEGWFRTNAVTGGTLIPQYTQTAGNVQPTVVADSWLMVQPMASGNPTLLAGGWA